jgi:hypothetical protein
VPHLVAHKEANKNERDDDCSGQSLPSASTCLHAAILAAALGQVYCSALNCDRPAGRPVVEPRSHETSRHISLHRPRRSGRVRERDRDERDKLERQLR